MQWRRTTAALAAFAIFMGAQGARASNDSFPDVEPGSWYYEAVTALSRTGVIEGFDDGSFRPDGKLTGAEFVKLVAYAAFPDEVGTSSSWWRGAYRAAKKLGVLDEALLAESSVDEPLTRNQAAVILANTLTAVMGEKISVPAGLNGYIRDSYDIPDAYRDGVYTAFAAGLLGGYRDGSFRGDNTLTRAEAAMLLYRLTRPASRLKLDPEKLNEPVSDEWFSDAAFLGDSLTHGMDLYSDLDTPDYYHYTGASVYSILGCSFDTPSGELSFDEALSSRKYGKVYILLGINEMGGSAEDYREQYGRVIDRVRELQPEATVYIQTVLPVSRDKEASSTTFTKANVLRYNEELHALAQEKDCRLVDTYAALADEGGYLPADETWDGVHLNTAYYIRWADYLRSHT